MHKIEVARVKLELRLEFLAHVPIVAQFVHQRRPIVVPLELILARLPRVAIGGVFVSSSSISRSVCLYTVCRNVLFGCSNVSISHLPAASGRDLQAAPDIAAALLKFSSSFAT